MRLLETLLPALTKVEGIEWVRASYLQPAEIRPGLLEVIATTAGVVPYFDLSFQHSSPSVLRRMRRFGGTDEFLGLINKVRSLSPQAGIRSNFIVGFPGETEEEFAQLEHFLTEGRLDVVGIFGYSDEDGTEAATMEGKLPQDEIDARVAHLSSLVEELVSQRAADRIGTTMQVLVESIDDDEIIGRGEHQAPEVDGTVTIENARALEVGDIVTVTITDSNGADLVAHMVESV